MKYIKLIGFIFACVTGVAQANVIDLDSTLGKTAAQQSSIQTISLNAGLYTVQAIGGAWNAWGDNITRGCDSNGLGCNRGWLSSFNVFTGSSNTQVGSNGLRFGSAAIAIDNAPSFTFNLASAQDVTFYVMDINYSDNFGTLQVAVSPVPEASTYALMLSGLGLVAFAVKRRKLKL